MGRVDRLDRLQKGHPALGFPIAVAYKMFDDRAPYLAALIAYYAFVSLFPLLLLFVAVVGFVLDGNPTLRQHLIDAALRNFPALGSKLRQNILGFHASGGALAIGILGTVYGGLGATQAAQTAFNTIYAVPRHRQPNPIRSRVRSLGLMSLLGLGVLLTTAVATFSSTAQSLPGALAATRYLGYLLTVLLNTALFTVAFQLLTAIDLRIRDVLAGGVVAGLLWAVLQAMASVFVAHELHQGNALYGAFGVVLAALGWIYLQALVLILAAEVNVVLHRRLWPRALLTPFTDDVDLTDADRAAYESYAKAQQFKAFEGVSAAFGDRQQPS